MFEDKVLQAGPSTFGIVPPFAFVDDVLVRLVGALQEARLLSLPRLRCSVIAKKVEPQELSGVLADMSRAWSDTRSYLK